MDNDDDKFHHFFFLFVCQNRLEFPVPTRYFGNCLKPGVVDIKKSELIGENGVVLAAKAIGKRIKEMERSGLRGQQHWQQAIMERIKTGRLTTAAGSPKLQVYDTDFGWGRSCKVELTHIENDGAIALAEYINEQGEIEVGIALDYEHMDEFVSIFEQSLKLLNV
ncbi:coumaroyl-CoA:anthocyanidin 3-O-glucoside-6''-O-coumaroyltransferase 1-like [Hibiscus syriacus]|nr:coumaroyl-CoA:anthocyanidin 3-O-glucoside-6''-O-coumaroyltransferase 1-like [Hibiscus syriacus]